MIYLVLILLNVGDIMANLIVRMNSVNEILSKRRMQNGGEAQVYLTKECAKAFNNYTPFLIVIVWLLDQHRITAGVFFYFRPSKPNFFPHREGVPLPMWLLKNLGNTTLTWFLKLLSRKSATPKTLHLE